MRRKPYLLSGLILLIGFNNLLWFLAYRAKPDGGVSALPFSVARDENAPPAAAKHDASSAAETTKLTGDVPKPAPPDGEQAIDPSSFNAPLLDNEGFLDPFFVERSGMTFDQRDQVNAAVKAAQGAFVAADLETFKTVKSTDERVVLLLDKHPELGAAAKRNLEDSLKQALPGEKSRLIREKIVEAAAWKTGSFGEYVRILDILPSGDAYKFQIRTAQLRENTMEQIERDKKYLDEDFYHNKASYWMKDIPSWLPQVFDKPMVPVLKGESGAE